MLLLYKDQEADFVGGTRVTKACINIIEAAYVVYYTYMWRYPKACRI